MNKNELKEGDVYVSQLSYNHFLNKYGSGFSLHLDKNNVITNKTLYKNSIYSYENMRLATPQEKHWLETCIKADKFISYDEAMKTFIPEYVECIRGYIGITKESAKIGKIYKTSEKPEFSIYKWDYLFQNHSHRFKPSTKEAYDAQFKELEFVLPTLWLLKIDNNNIKLINKFRKEICKYTFSINQYKYPYISSNGSGDDGTLLKKNNYKEITFEQFQKYVLKQDKIVKEVVKVKSFEILSYKSSINHKIYTLNENKVYIADNKTIIHPEYMLDKDIQSVINEEGNIFMIGDMITPSITGSPNKGKGFKITGFRLNVDKSMICAITNKHTLYGIGIDKIEHFIEKDKPVVIAQGHSDQLRLAKSGINSIVIPNETLLEKAKRLYPVGIKFNNYEIAHGGNWDVEVLTDNIFENEGRIKLRNPENASRNSGTWTLYENGKWAEIIGDKPKVGDRFNITTWNSDIVLIITKIVNSENPYCEYKIEANNYQSDNTTVLLKNIKIIK